MGLNSSRTLFPAVESRLYNLVPARKCEAFNSLNLLSLEAHTGQKNIKKTQL